MVRTGALNDFQEQVRRALRQAGARLDGLTDPGVWAPHVTLLDRALTPARLAAAVGCMAGRPHCSWTIVVDAIIAGARLAGWGLRPANRRIP